MLTHYAVSFNLRHNRIGHLFHGRFKSPLCERDAYLLELVRYIHLNPAARRKGAILCAAPDYAESAMVGPLSVGAAVALTPHNLAGTSTGGDGVLLAIGGGWLSFAATPRC